MINEINDEELKDVNGGFSDNTTRVVTIEEGDCFERFGCRYRALETVTATNANVWVKVWRDVGSFQDETENTCYYLADGTYLGKNVF